MKKNINNLKVLLANEATKILHGEKKAKDSEKTSKVTFEGKGVGKNLPETLIKKSLLKNGIHIIDLLYNSKIFNSKSEVRRAINEKGIKLNDTLVDDEKKIISLGDFKENNYIKVSHGKKKHFIIKLS